MRRGTGVGVVAVVHWESRAGRVMRLLVASETRGPECLARSDPGRFEPIWATRGKPKMKPKWPKLAQVGPRWHQDAGEEPR